MQCGKDSDCNPSNAAGILFTTIGFENLPVRFTSALTPEEVFSYTDYSFSRLLEVCVEQAEGFILSQGGRIAEEDGEIIYYIPNKQPQPSPLQKSWEPEPYQEVRFDQAQLEQLEAHPFQAFEPVMQAFAPDFGVDFCSRKVEPALLDSFQGKERVLVTTPMNEQRGVMIRLNDKLQRAEGEQVLLHFSAGHAEGESWKLKVNVNYKPVLEEVISAETTTGNWKDFTIDITEYTGSNWFFMYLEAENIRNTSGLSKNYWSGLKVEKKKVGV
jgi:hypothetical protein